MLFRLGGGVLFLPVQVSQSVSSNAPLSQSPKGGYLLYIK